VRVSSIAPPVDGGEVEVSSRRIGLWKSPGDQMGQRRFELGERLAEAPGGYLWRNVARFDVEAHWTTEKSSYRRR
jgi:hypothetical protein